VTNHLQQVRLHGSQGEYKDTSLEGVDFWESLKSKYRSEGEERRDQGFTVHEEARSRSKGVNTLADAVKVTMGPQGRNVILDKSFGATTVTKRRNRSQGNELKTSSKTWRTDGRVVASEDSDVAGDGTTTASILAQAIYREAPDRRRRQHPMDT
jgi:chaperonin GroEL (HSP60 family)